ncbi:MAG: glutathione S-transferase family protein [Pseudomonadota bacterium]
MSANPEETRFQLDYWPIPFRGSFISFLFAYREVPLLECSGLDENVALKNAPLHEQSVPYIGPPVLHDRQTGTSLSQMPAIVLYAADILDLMPKGSFARAMALKILMDCNDLLMEISRYNGSDMWDRDAWREFRDARLPRWLGVFEESLRREYLGRTPVSFADISVFALFGTLIRCLPQLESDILEHAPGIHALCERIGATPSLRRCVARQRENYGELYCGGLIEKLLRAMLADDESER